MGWKRDADNRMCRIGRKVEDLNKWVSRRIDELDRRTGYGIEYSTPELAEKIAALADAMGLEIIFRDSQPARWEVRKKQEEDGPGGNDG